MLSLRYLQNGIENKEFIKKDMVNEYIKRAINKISTFSFDD